MAAKVQDFGSVDVTAVSAAIVARHDAEAIVAELLRLGSRMNEHAVRFVSEPTACLHVSPLAFSMVAWTEAMLRLGEGGGAEDISGGAMRCMTSRLEKMIPPTLHAVELAHRACRFAKTVWSAVGGEVSAEAVVHVENVTPSCGNKPH